MKGWRRTASWSIGLAAAVCMATGCPGEDTGGEDTGTAVDGGDAVADDAGGDGTTGEDADGSGGGGDGTSDVQNDVADGTDGGESGTEFQVTVTNTSGGTHFPTPFGPLAWAVHGGGNPIDETGSEASGPLETLAEDGNPGPLADQLEQASDVARAGTLGSSPLTPDSNALQGSFRASPDTGRFSFASMLVQSNDLYVSTGSEGLSLFDDEGEPVARTMLVGDLSLMDAGSERNQAPAMGPVQAPRQAEGDTGAAEGVVAPYQDSTRALPQPEDFVDVSVSSSGGTLTVTVAAVQNDVITTPLGGVYHATHNDDFSFFDPTGGNSATSGLETLAEDGSPSALVTETEGGSNVTSVGAAAPSEPPISPGESVEFDVTPDSDHRYMSFASMVVQSNDAFIAPTGDGIRVADESGELRPTSEIQADIRRKLAVWDAGTEENEVPGIGPSQAPRQDSESTGPNDSNSNVRLYRDATNDLRPDVIGNQFDVSVSASDNSFEISFQNVDPDNNPFPFHLTPLAVVVHDEGVPPFEMGQPAGSGLESLAEDGQAGAYLDSLPDTGAESALKQKKTVSTRDGGGDGPIAPGQGYTFTVEPDSNRAHLSLLSMIVPSNDAFLATGTSGVSLMDGSGNLRNEGDVEADIEEALQAWDAGTEKNQPGAAGPHQATGPNLPGGQSSAGEGPTEGNGQVRAYDGLYSYPQLGDVLQVTVEPTGN